MPREYRVGSVVGIRVRGSCSVCGAKARTARAYTCDGCFIGGKPASVEYAVLSAIRRGDLPHPKTLPCADCGRPAHSYDHRDYNKPLEVDPVCQHCNHRRGAAVPYAGRPAGCKP